MGLILTAGSAYVLLYINLKTNLIYIYFFQLANIQFKIKTFIQSVQNLLLTIMHPAAVSPDDLTVTNLSPMALLFFLCLVFVLGCSAVLVFHVWLH